jgi:hypothetical protein
VSAISTQNSPVACLHRIDTAASNGLGVFFVEKECTHD